MRSWSGSQTDTGASAPEEEKPGKRRKAFCLARMKSRNSSEKQPHRQQHHEPAVNNNNNTPFVIHCQIGKEIKHICSNCRGAEPLDGERTTGYLRGGGGALLLLLNGCGHLWGAAPCPLGEREGSRGQSGSLF